MINRSEQAASITRALRYASGLLGDIKGCTPLTGSGAFVVGHHRPHAGAGVSV